MDAKNLLFRTVMLAALVVFTATTIAWSAPGLCLRQQSAEERGVFEKKLDTQQESVKPAKAKRALGILSRDKKDQAGFLYLGAIRDWWRIRRIKKICKNELEDLRLVLGEKRMIPASDYMDNSIILPTAKVAQRLEGIKLCFIYLKDSAIRLKEKGVSPFHIYYSAFPAIAGVAKTTDELQSSLIVLGDLVVKLKEKHIDPSYDFYGISTIAKTAKNTEELNLFLQLGIRLTERGIDPYLVFEYGIPAVAGVAKTREELQSFIAYLEDLANRGCIKPGYTYTNGFSVTTKIARTPAELDVCLSSLSALEGRLAARRFHLSNFYYGELISLPVMKLPRTIGQFNQLIAWLSTLPSSLLNIEEQKLDYLRVSDPELESIYGKNGFIYLADSTRKAKSIRRLNKLILKQIKIDRKILAGLIKITKPTLPVSDAIDLGEDIHRPIYEYERYEEWETISGYVTHYKETLVGYEHHYDFVKIGEKPNPAYVALNNRIALLERVIADLEKMPSPSAIAVPISLQPAQVTPATNAILNSI